MKTIAVFSDKVGLSAELVTAARSLGDNVIAFVCGCDDPACYSNIGADSVLFFGKEMAVSYSKAIASYIDSNKVSLLVASNDTVGREVAASVAGFLDCPMISDCQSISVCDGSFCSERMMYGGALVVKEKFDNIGVVTIGGGKYPISEGSSELVTVDADADNRIQFVSSDEIVKESVDLTVAEKVVGAGMGFTTRAELDLAYSLADALGAEVGCSRALAEDKHWFSEYIGLSGVQLNPKLYFALGISGQIQHSVGVRGAQTLIAINKDENCPIMNNCDYGIAGDMFELVPLLIEEIKTL